MIFAFRINLTTITFQDEDIELRSESDGEDWRPGEDVESSTDSSQSSYHGMDSVCEDDHAQNFRDQLVDDADDEFQAEGRGGLGESQDIYSTTAGGSSSDVCICRR